LESGLLTYTAAPFAELGLCLVIGAAIGTVLAGAFEALPPRSSITSVSISFKFDFQHITTESAPDEVKKSPLGEKLTVFAEPSWPYKLYRMWPCLRSQILTVESADDDRR
jgi:hypothetical protein